MTCPICGTGADDQYDRGDDPRRNPYLIRHGQLKLQWRVLDGRKPCGQCAAVIERALQVAVEACGGGAI